jgi:Fe-S cluster assembly protein SufD
MTAVSEQIGNWLELFTAQPPAEAWRKQLRDGAFERFCALGFPTTRDEEWRFTSVAPIARTRWSEAPEAIAGSERAADAVAPWTTGGIRLVFVNGRLTGPVPALPQGLEAGLLTERSELNLIVPKTAFVALNTAFLGEVAWVKAARGAVVETPIHLVYITTADAYVAPRVLIQAGADAHLTVVESFVGTGAYFTNAVTEIAAGQGAVVDHYKVQCESLDAYHIAALGARLGQISAPTPFRSAASWCATILARCFPKAPKLPSTASISSTARNTSITTPPSTTPSRTAPATSFIRAYWTASRARSSTARLSSARMRKKPIPNRPTRTWC